MSTAKLKSFFRSKIAQTADPEGAGTEITPTGLTGPIDLPAELQLLIFETTARYHCSTIPSLLCLSRNINNYLNAIIYKTINLLAFPPVPSHPSTGRKPPTTTWTPWVQNLLVGGILPSQNYEEEVLSLISKFRSTSSTTNLPLINLGIWSRTPTHTLLPHLASLRIQRLSTSFASLCGSDLQPASNLDLDWKAHITHLDLTRYLDPATSSTTNSDPQVRTKKWSHLRPGFPSLTHLAINELIPLSDIRTLLADPPQGDDASQITTGKPLEVLVLIRPPRGDHAPWNVMLHSSSSNGTIKDPRLVLLAMTRYHSEEWQAGVRGQEDFWSVAEHIVTAKQAGDFQGAEHTWISREQWALDLNTLKHQRWEQTHNRSPSSS